MSFQNVVAIIAAFASISSIIAGGIGAVLTKKFSSRHMLLITIFVVIGLLLVLSAAGGIAFWTMGSFTTQTSQSSHISLPPVSPSTLTPTPASTSTVPSDGTPTTSGTLTTDNGTPAPTVGNGTDSASLRQDCHTDIIALADTANPPYPNRPYSYPVGSAWLLNIGNGTLTGQLYYCPQENSIFGVFSVTGTSTTGSCSLQANYGTISINKNIPTVYNKTSPWIYGTCSSPQYDQFTISPDNSASRQQQTTLGETYSGDTWQLCWATQSQHTDCSLPIATPAS